jgi:hypothetical protein
MTDEKFYQYRIWTKDVCGNMQSIGTKATNSILLDANLIDKQITMAWNSYPEVLSGMQYDIEQQEIDGSWTKLATVNKNTTDYVDENIYERINRPLCYRVNAVFDGYPDYTSTSNTSCYFTFSFNIPKCFFT